MSEADDPAEWAQVMADRYGLGDVDHLTEEAKGMTVEERAEFLVIGEKLTFLEAMSGRGKQTGD